MKDERRQIDFEDVLLVTAGMIESEPRVAEQVRAQYRFFVVDEYQDVSPAAAASCSSSGSAIAHRPLRRRRREPDDLLVRGGVERVPAGVRIDATTTPTILRLERNYRSAPAVLDTANRLMRGRAGCARAECRRSTREARRADVAEPSHRSRTPTNSPRRGPWPRASAAASRGTRARADRRAHTASTRRRRSSSARSPRSA